MKNQVAISNLHYRDLTDVEVARALRHIDQSKRHTKSAARAHLLRRIAARQKTAA